MPFYDFKCPKCGGKETRSLNMNNEHPQRCSRCGHERMERQISDVSVGKTGKGDSCAPPSGYG